MGMHRPYIDRIKPYCAIGGLYALLLVVLKLIEYGVGGVDAPNELQILGNALLYNLVVTSWIFLGFGLLYLLLHCLSKRVALIVSAVFYGLLLLAETGLLLYTLHNGYLLGSELLARPFSETLLAIRGAVGVLLPITLIAVLIGGFTAFALWRARKPSKASIAVVPIAILLALMSLVFEVSHLVPHQYSYFILNKTQFLVGDCYDYLREVHRHDTLSTVSVPEYDEALIHELLLTHPEWGTPIDTRYPLERPACDDDFLSPYFDTCAKTPNVVILIVESMGAEVYQSGAMPFVDSLAKTGLCWPNGITTTTRSYGAIPAITGSVGGPKSFQFGTMPAHNSLLSLLKHEGYSTRSYYAGQYTFDCIYDYLAAQNIDYLSPFFEELANSGNQQNYWWGFQDDDLLRRTLEDLSSLNESHPYCALVTTLTMHDALRLADSRQQDYEQRARLLPSSPPGSSLDGLYPACLFTDDQLRFFFKEYSHRADFGQTIFVLTGDHSSGRQRGDKLSLHHVPIIIWSPLITQPACFSHPVTHNDIAPALYQLLTNHYGLKRQPTVHWLGDGLGPTPKTLLIVDYSHEIHDIIYHNHYYQSPSRFEPEILYAFGDDLVMHTCDNPSYLDSCQRQLTLMRYLYDYTYRADRLTSHPLNTRLYTTIHTFRPPGNINCITPELPPSQIGNVLYPILPKTTLENTEGYATVRVTLESDVIVHDSIDQQCYPYLFFRFKGDSSVDEYDLLSKFLTGDVVGRVGSSHINLSKEFPLSATQQNSITLELSTPWFDNNHQPGTQITLINTLITIDYGTN